MIGARAMMARISRSPARVLRVPHACIQALLSCRSRGAHSDVPRSGLGGVFSAPGPFALCATRTRIAAKLHHQALPRYDLDLLCRTRAVRKVRAGIAAMEGNLGLARGIAKP